MKCWNVLIYNEINIWNKKEKKSIHNNVETCIIKIKISGKVEKKKN